MADVQTKYQTRIEKVMVEKSVTKLVGVTLELSVEEAIALYILSGSLGGPMEGSIRPYTDQFYNKIHKLLGLSGFDRKQFVAASTDHVQPPYQGMAEDGYKAEEFIQKNAKLVRERLTN